MRSRIIDYLNLHFPSVNFKYIIPDISVIYAIMLIVGAIIYIKRCSSLSKYHASGIAIWASIAGLLGARIFYLIQNIEYTIHHPSIIYEINGATVSFGVYLGGILGIFLYSKFYKLVPWSYLDTAASVLGIGPLIGRWSCFLNGDDYGTLSNLPWAVRFPPGSYPFINHVANGWLSPTAELSLPVHPVQIYGSLKGLILFIGFTILWKKNLFKPGVLFFLFIMAYAVCRFILEFFRGDMDRGWVGKLSTGQFMSILLFGISAICISLIYKWKISNVPATQPET